MSILAWSNHYNKYSKTRFKIALITIGLLFLIIFMPTVAWAAGVGDVVTGVANSRYASPDYEFGTEPATGLSIKMHAGYGGYANGYSGVSVLGPTDNRGMQALLNYVDGQTNQTVISAKQLKGCEVREYTMSDGVGIGVVLPDYFITVEFYETGNSQGSDLAMGKQIAQETLDALEKAGLLSQKAPDIEANGPTEAEPQAVQTEEASVTGNPLDESIRISETMNIAGVYNHPTVPTIFSINSPHLITEIMNYHWNDAQGSTPGTISLVDQNGSTYGPWQAKGTPGQGGVPNANWHVYPNIVVPAGTYTIIDSEPGTWAQNDNSGGRGMGYVNATPHFEVTGGSSGSSGSSDYFPGEKIPDFCGCDSPAGVGSVGNIPAPSNTTEAVTGVVVPGLIATSLGALAGLGGGGGGFIPPVGGSPVYPTSGSPGPGPIRGPEAGRGANGMAQGATNQIGRRRGEEIMVSPSDYADGFQPIEPIPVPAASVLPGAIVDTTDMFEGIIQQTPVSDSDIIIDTTSIDEKLGEIKIPLIELEQGETKAFVLANQGGAGAEPGVGDIIIDATKLEDKDLVITDKTTSAAEEVSSDEAGLDAEAYDAEGFDQDGYNAEGYDVQGYNKEGYDAQGFDKEGFDQAGYNAEGFDKTGFDQEGFDKAGFDKAGYDRNGYDKEGFDQAGYNAEGFDKTGFDQEGFDKAGFDKAGYDRNGYDKEGFDQAGYNAEGFDKTGFDQEGFDKAGFDKAGYDRYGYDKEGFDKAGYNAEGFDKTGFDQEGFDKAGFDKAGYDRNGYDKEGFDQAGYNAEGFDKKGFDQAGFDRSGFDKEGFNRNGFDKAGFDAKGFDKEGFDQAGYNAEGFDKTGFNREGYDQAGFNKNGFDKDGYGRNGFDAEGFDRDGYTVNGYDRQGYNRQGYDAKGYNKAGFDKAGFDKNGFDHDGFDSKGFNKAGWDRDGYDENGYNAEGYNRQGLDKSGQSAEGYDADGYDRNGFNENGTDRDGFDREGFNFEGYNRSGYDPWGYNRQGYGKDGYHWSGYNADGYNRSGRHWSENPYEGDSPFNVDVARNPFDGGIVIVDGVSGGSDLSEGWKPTKPPLGEPYHRTVEKYGAKSWGDTIPNEPEIEIPPQVPESSGIIGPEDPMNTIKNHGIGDDELPLAKEKPSLEFGDPEDMPESEMPSEDIPAGEIPETELPTMPPVTGPQHGDTIILPGQDGRDYPLEYNSQTGEWENLMTGGKIANEDLDSYMKDFNRWQSDVAEDQRRTAEDIAKMAAREDATSKAIDKNLDDWRELEKMQEAARKHNIGEPGGPGDMEKAIQDLKDKMLDGQELDRDRAEQLKDIIKNRISGKTTADTGERFNEDWVKNLGYALEANAATAKEVITGNKEDGSISWLGMSARILATAATGGLAGGASLTYVGLDATLNVAEAMYRIKDSVDQGESDFRAVSKAIGILVLGEEISYLGSAAGGKIMGEMMERFPAATNKTYDFIERGLLKASAKNQQWSRALGMISKESAEESLDQINKRLVDIGSEEAAKNIINSATTGYGLNVATSFDDVSKIGTRTVAGSSDDLVKGIGKTVSNQTDDVAKGAGKAASGQADDVAKGAGKAASGQADDVAKGTGKAAAGQADDVAKGASKATAGADEIPGGRPPRSADEVIADPKAVAKAESQIKNNVNDFDKLPPSKQQDLVRDQAIYDEYKLQAQSRTQNIADKINRGEDLSIDEMMEMKADPASMRTIKNLDKPDSYTGNLTRQEAENVQRQFESALESKVHQPAYNEVKNHLHGKYPNAKADEIRVTTVRTPGSDPHAININTDNDVIAERLVQGPHGPEWVEIPKTEWEDTYYKAFAEKSGFSVDKASERFPQTDWKKLDSAAQNKRWAKYHEEAAMDQFDLDAGRDFSSQRTWHIDEGTQAGRPMIEASPEEIARGVETVTIDGKEMRPSSAYELVQRRQGTLLDGEQLGLMEGHKIDAYWNAGDTPADVMKNQTEALEQLRKTANIAKTVEEAYGDMGYKVADMPKNMQEAIKVINNNNLSPATRAVRLQELGYSSPGDFMDKVTSRIGAIRTATKK